MQYYYFEYKKLNANNRTYKNMHTNNVINLVGGGKSKLKPSTKMTCAFVLKQISTTFD